MIPGSVNDVWDPIEVLNNSSNVFIQIVLNGILYKGITSFRTPDEMVLQICIRS
jgi:hypothetical protein